MCIIYIIQFILLFIFIELMLFVKYVFQILNFFKNTFFSSLDVPFTGDVIFQLWSSYGIKLWTKLV